MSYVPKAARGTFYRRKCMAALDIIVECQKQHKRNPKLSEIAQGLGVSEAQAYALLQQARAAGFIKWQSRRMYDLRFVKSDGSLSKSLVERV